MNHKKMIIAIDGYSSSGKSLLSQDISNLLEYKYIDTGSMYRIITLLAIRKNFVPENNWNMTNFISFLKTINWTFQCKKKSTKITILINGKNEESKLRSSKITKQVHFFAKIPEIRNILTENIKKNVGNKKGFVINGRDIGNHVYPQSDLKFFIKGSLKVRVYRRYKSILIKGKNVSYEKIKKSIIIRDDTDTYRQTSPLKKSADHIEIDNTFLNRKEQLELVMKLINQKIIKKLY
ncbi:(d)CMP kinase [Blattabacterium cuenoti]|uniref:(d)CMP kinase n=1 Tax=Blattabacterium cuenoti TaxID=1653831 RepID=UPI00163C0E89|nr:(d)CMP kinase [Blattabacterium cuenoti]